MKKKKKKPLRIAKLFRHKTCILRKLSCHNCHRFSISCSLRTRHVSVWKKEQYYVQTFSKWLEHYQNPIANVSAYTLMSLSASHLYFVHVNAILQTDFIDSDGIHCWAWSTNSNFYPLGRLNPINFQRRCRRALLPSSSLFIFNKFRLLRILSIYHRVEYVKDGEYVNYKNPNNNFNVTIINLFLFILYYQSFIKLL